MKPRLQSTDKVVLTVAPTGGLHGKEANAALPEQPEDIIDAFAECYEAGATIAHIHVRDKEGRTSCDPVIYGEVIAGIKERCPDMITQVGNGIGIRREGDGRWTGFTQAERMALLDLDPAPDMLTVNAGTFHFQHKDAEFLFDNSKAWNREFITGCRERGIINELEVYDVSHILNMMQLRDEGILTDPMHFSFVLGINGGVAAEPKYLLTMLEAIPENSNWQIVSVGRSQLPLTTMAVAMGGNMRTGFEDTVFYARGELAESNRQLVERAGRIINELGREVADIDYARAMLHHKPNDPMGRAASA
ncbi:3-keto-5-aminohexanoate cleavage enzyme [Roseovarius halotolerans]|uniref:3-keto-5-aminohexanoate cleavage enzyme n=1 Tax=Roseovarius halotolerans TaxID=505353 RepID=A0A1X6ZY83_9RHOB|nr:3-keto-5-aminohexanoate cleavage protein [Roseovarius halotolerans]RKT32161.1 3-keto-5-aminohexanoate cleavage enzyme [Roseovarius halotolerans]SLN64434.1 3-keto-5-aminohexanoate cleavage enzyme [Roseovarius halotolerans]